MTAEDARPLREGSADKRAAIVGAARELFLADGFDRTSVDAIAARAGVSKRTVYDYFGDKRALLGTVVEQVVTSLSSAVDDAVAASLVTITDLEQALVGFARSITVSAIGSPDYAALTRLVSMESANLGELPLERWPEEPEELLARRFAALGEEGLLAVPDPRLAADHFVALTLSASADGIRNPRADTGDDDRRIVEGVRAFLRAYRP
ncbi:TetR/AcrR family transcriptional regulator [soil metagenome]